MSAAQRVVPSILPYTLLKKEDGSPLLVFLLWRDRRSSAVESSTFWCSIVCPMTKEDNSPLDAVTRGFSEKTKGIFAPATMVYDDENQLEAVQRKSPPKQRIEDSRIFLRKKIVQGNGVTILTIRQYITYVAPVRFIDAATLNSTFGMDKGECEWITAQDLFSALYSTIPDNAVAIRTRSYLTATTLSSHPATYALALPFTVTLRTSEARSELAAILKQFNVDVDATIHAPTQEPETDDPSSMPDVSSLAVSSSSSAAASSSTSTAVNVAPPARTPETIYSCRKCRKLLFTDVDLSQHTLPTLDGSNRSLGKFAHKHIKVAEGGRRINTDCSSYFVGNHDVLGEFPPGEGNLVCSKCQTRYGQYCWSGAQCSCGEWIVPAFQVVKSKVDERPAGGPSKTAHVAFQFQRPPPRTPVVPPSLSVAATDASASSVPAAATSAPSIDATPATVPVVAQP